MNHPWLPRLIAALGFLGLTTSFACFPITIASIPVGGATPEPPPTAATRAPRSPSPAPSAEATPTPPAPSPT